MKPFGVFTMGPAYTLRGQTAHHSYSHEKDGAAYIDHDGEEGPLGRQGTFKFFSGPPIRETRMALRKAIFSANALGTFQTSPAAPK
ncbi:MAG: hypothetical protein ABW199_00700 [Caulobacterales bacterium]